MTPHVLTQRLVTALGSHLTSVILFGSSAAGDHTGRRSDYNVLVVLDRLGVKELHMLSKVAQAWGRAGNPSPLLFTRESLVESVRAFPLEMADIKDSHQILFGKDVISALVIDMTALRFELEHELRGKLMRLRSRYLLTHGRPREITELMVQSLSTFLALFRGALRLYEPGVPRKKFDALAAFATHLPVKTTVFETVWQLKMGRRIPGLEPGQLFVEYLQAIESVVEAVDARLHPTRAQEGKHS